jgi:hypothetical protein
MPLSGDERRLIDQPVAPQIRLTDL